MGDAPALAALILTHLAQAALITALAWVVLRNIAAGSARARLALACTAYYGAALLPLTALLPHVVSVSVGASAPAEIWKAPVITTAPWWLAGLSFVIVAVIAAGIGWRLGMTLLAAVRGERMAARVTPLSSGDFGLPEDVRVGCSEEASGPAVAGLLRPAILLPARLVGAPYESLLPLLHHEYAHLVRGDVRNMLLQRIVADLFWWNPAIRLMAGWLEEAREAACDDIACAATDRRAYAQALIAEARYRVAPQELVTAAGGGSVERRLERLVEPRRVRACLSAAALAAIALLVGAASTPRASTENVTHIGIASS